MGAVVLEVNVVEMLASEDLIGQPAVLDVGVMPAHALAGIVYAIDDAQRRAANRGQ